VSGRLLGFSSIIGPDNVADIVRDEKRDKGKRKESTHFLNTEKAL
jgi:hypothetical protein